MKRFVLIVLVALFSVQLMAQRVPSEKKMSISAGVTEPFSAKIIGTKPDAGLV